MPTPAEIATRGIKSVRVGDRSHEYFSPKELRELTQLEAADALDEQYGGFVNIEMKGLSDIDTE
jgi:hypothetical protein